MVEILVWEINITSKVYNLSSLMKVVKVVENPSGVKHLIVSKWNDCYINSDKVPISSDLPNATFFWVDNSQKKKYFDSSNSK